MFAANGAGDQADVRYSCQRIWCTDRMGKDSGRNSISGRKSIAFAADLYERRERKREEKLLEQLKKSIPDETKDAKLAFEQAKEAFTLQCQQKETADYEALDALEAAFDFADAAFEKGEEMIVFVTDLTMTSISAAFLAQHTCKRYYEYNKELLIGTRRQELLSELADE